ncbi:hypothetical protein [Mycobacterium sp. 236(2023)]|uniref:hypothetical protein n=1 Tax=Mycobacterium sp. 236(2023) TaxID=3038163 RepID=UPI0024154D3B|nr:hypothetical protein [Mycobacterium sp. 236(2023)]MDG4664670.1 hypothetical protein [Mycobacterium sp. 236(2023)]
MVEPGLTDDEIARIEDTFGFEFADDHRAFLAAGLPVGAAWPHWRDEGRRSLAKRMQLPVEGVLFAVEWSRFWHEPWGPRPAQMKHALRTAKYELERAPQLVPVHAHHYLPAGRGSTGHPVLSVVRTEVVVSAATLADYVDGPTATTATPTVGFWSDLVSR